MQHAPEVIDEVRLSMVRGVGPMMRRRLVDSLGSATAALSTDRARLMQVQGVGRSIAEAIRAAPSTADTEAMLANAAAKGIRPVTPACGEFPPGLLEIPDTPPVLYVRGTLSAADRRAVAIVGTRRPTRYGVRQAERFARELVRAGVTVVSGLARGIDGVAHRAALDEGGRTLAALAGGLSTIYPPEHADLANAVAASGALIAEAAPPLPPMSGSFPQRNRIISGLSLGVLVIEAADRSGALITAHHAAEQGRDAYATPGPIDSPQSSGCHRLIQEGAKLVASIDDILCELPDAPPSVAAPSAARMPAAAPVSVVRAAPELPEPERTVLARIGDDSIAIDALVELTELPVHRVLASISRLEAGGNVVRVSGALVRRV